jgi:hypothetical protein
MLTEQDVKDFKMLDQYFNDCRTDLVISSAKEENTRIKLWTDQKYDNAILWDLANNVIYVNSSSQTTRQINDFKMIFRKIIRGDSLKTGREYFRIVWLNDSSYAYVSFLVEQMLVRNIKYRHYIHDSPISQITQKLEPNLTIEQITTTLLKAKKYRFSELILQEINQMWPSLRQFYSHGYGITIHNQKEICAWCTSEYVSKGKCGIGIETIEKYQNRG